MKTLKELEFALGDTELLSLEDEAAMRGLTPEQLVQEALAGAEQLVSQRTEDALFNAAVDHYTDLLAAS